MALSRVAHTNEASRQCSRPVGALRSVQLEAPVHAQEGKPLRCNQSGEPCHGEAHVDRLQPLMGDCRPTQQICLAMIKLIEAEEVLQVTINYEKDKHATTGYAKAKASPSSRHLQRHLRRRNGALWRIEALSAEDLQRT